MQVSTKPGSDHRIIGSEKQQQKEPSNGNVTQAEENQVVLREFNRSWNLCVKVPDTVPMLTLKLIQVIH